MRILLAVSGGIDSMYMLKMASGLFPGAHFAVAHCNFCLRGDESDGDEQFVKEECALIGLEFFSQRFNTAGQAKATGASIEMAARELRYSWFAQLCRERQFDAVAVAHNANDNAETLILNLLRGAGAKGTRGMAAKSTTAEGLTVLRPMLGITRAQIEQTMRSEGWQWREDHTNAQNTYKRNMIRNEVFPVFERINPSFIATLGQDMQHLQQVGDIAEDYYTNCGISAKQDTVSLSELKSLKHWEYVLFRTMSERGAGAAEIASLTEAIKCGSQIAGRTFGPAVCSSSEIIFNSTIQPCSYIVEELSAAQAGDPKTAEGAILLDASKISLPLTIRPWREGDWMQPLGLGGKRKKLSDMFVDLKYSMPQKKAALVVELEGSHIGALLFSRIDESLKVSDSTVSVIRIRRV